MWIGNQPGTPQVIVPTAEELQKWTDDELFDIIKFYGHRRTALQGQPPTEDTRQELLRSALVIAGAQAILQSRFQKAPVPRATSDSPTAPKIFPAVTPETQPTAPSVSPSLPGTVVDNPRITASGNDPAKPRPPKKPIPGGGVQRIFSPVVN